MSLTIKEGFASQTRVRPAALTKQSDQPPHPYSYCASSRSVRYSVTMSGLDVEALLESAAAPSVQESRDSRDRDDHSSDSEDPSDDDSRGSRRRGEAKPRRSVFQAIAMENDWKAARKTLRWQLTADIFFALIWAAEFVFILWGKKCPPGEFEGWYVHRSRVA